MIYPPNSAPLTDNTLWHHIIIVRQKSQIAAFISSQFLHKEVAVHDKKGLAASPQTMRQSLLPNSNTYDYVIPADGNTA
jgi:hypothetical protein